MVLTCRPSRHVRLLAFAAALGCCVAAARGQSAGWPDQRWVGPFVCHSEFPLSEIDRLILDLRRLQADLVEQLGVPEAKEPIELYLFRGKSSYRQFLEQNYPRLPHRRALYVKDGGVGRVFAYRSEQFDTDVRHECTHALLHAALPVVPLWLDEGLAEYYELPAEKRSNEHPHQNNLRWAILLGTLPNLEDLEQKDGVAEMGRAEYRAAWAWVHFMLHGSGEGREELTGFLADIAAGTPPGLLSGRLQRRLGDASGRFSSHFRDWQKQR